MGLLTDVLVASPSEAEAICKGLRHSENWPCWQVKGFDNLVFSDLVRALGAEADAESLAGDDRLIYGGEGGPWVFHLPEVIPESLSTLEDDELPGLAERWLQEEKSPGYEEGLVESVALALKDLRELSKQALAANKSLLLWICL